MTQFRTIDLPKGSYSSSRTLLRRYAPPADLLSQMLQQRPAPANPVRAKETIATDAYAYTAKATVVRMPAGYRRTVIA
jgi:hypothetical protein